LKGKDKMTDFARGSKLFCICFMLIISLTLISYAEAQDLIQYQGKTVDILLKSGLRIKGKVLAVNQDGSLSLRMSSGFPMTVMEDEIDLIQLVKIAKHGSIGAGLGIPYGILGLNLDLNLIEYLTLSAGIGTTLFSDKPGYSIGGRLYLASAEKTWRPRISAFYGTIGGIQITYYYDEYYEPSIEPFSSDAEVFYGPIVGIGISSYWGQRKNYGIDIDLIYILDNKVAKRAEEMESEGYIMEGSYGSVKFSFGVRYAF